MLSNNNSLSASYDLFSSLQTNNPSNSVPPRYAKNKDFDSSFPGMFIYKPKYEFCHFTESVFDRPAGESTVLFHCGLYDCIIQDADFRFCDFEYTIFETLEKKCIIKNSNLSYGTLYGSQFIGVDISGTPFREMVIKSCVFKNCIFNSFGFERTIIQNCSFENIDMSRIVFRFCEFDNVSFKNAIIHILDLAKNYGLINELIYHGENVKIYYNNDGIMTLEEALRLLPQLLPYYLDKQEYYYIINILMLEKRIEDIITVLPKAFEFYTGSKDFSSLQDLCSLVVKLNICDQKQLKQLYNIITNQISANDLSYHELKSYVSYIANIKNILLDNPNGYPSAHLHFYTKIQPNEIEKTFLLVQEIEKSITINYPSISPKIQISHHSPYEIEVFISALLPELLTICQLFYYAFGGVKSLKDIIDSRHEKTEKKPKQLPLQKNIIKKKSKKVSVKIGKACFEYSKESTEEVENMEYLIS